MGRCRKAQERISILPQPSVSLRDATIERRDEHDFFCRTRANSRICCIVDAVTALSPPAFEQCPPFVGARRQAHFGPIGAHMKNPSNVRRSISTRRQSIKPDPKEGQRSC